MMPSCYCTSNIHARRAFTLIELLVVVAIISILASIAVPNFLEAQVRAKVARVKNDMRAMMTGIETYRIDNDGKCPVRRNTQGIKNARYDPSETNPNSTTYGEYTSVPSIPEIGNATNPHFKAAQMSRLTTPIAYLTTLPVDIFERFITHPNNTIDYWDEYQTMWFILNYIPASNAGYVKQKINGKPSPGRYLLVSVGPDGYLGLGKTYSSLTKQYGWPYNASSDIVNSMYHSYDPSNGTISAGNLYFSPDLGGMDGTAVNLRKQLTSQQ